MRGRPSIVTVAIIVCASPSSGQEPSARPSAVAAPISGCTYRIDPCRPARTVVAAPLACEAPCVPTACAGHGLVSMCGRDTCGYRHGSWTLTLEGGAAALDRRRGPFGVPLPEVDSPLSFEGDSFDVTPAARVSVAARTSCTTRFDLRGTWWGSPTWDDRQAGAFGATPGASGTGDASAPVSAAFDIDASLWGIEVGSWREVRPGGPWSFDFGVGLRYLRFDEDAVVSLTPTGAGPFPVGAGFASAEATTDVLAGQVMLGARWTVADGVSVAGSVRAFAGWADRAVDVTDLNLFAGGEHSASSDEVGLALGLDAELGVAVRLSERVSIGASYQLLFLEGVQRASRSFDFSHSDSGAVQARDDGGDLLLHAVWLGLTLDI